MKWSLLISSILLIACSGTEIHQSCDVTDAFNIICNIQQPEDLALLPNKKGLLVAEFGDAGENTGHFSLYRHDTKSYRKLYPSHSARKASEKKLTQKEKAEPASADSNWGEKNCQPTNTTSPHGIHLSFRDHTMQLLAVNHGENEQVLMFEVLLEPEVRLINRGCVNFPKSVFLNDVVALPDGGLAASSMLDKNNQFLSIIKGFFGANSGLVWRWSATTGLTQLENSQGALPNGLEIDKSGEHLFINMSLGNKVVKYSLSDQQALSSAEVTAPDNSSWSDDGELIVSSLASPITEYIPCFHLHKGSCGAGFNIVSINSENMTSRVLYQHLGGGPFGASTIAVQDKEVWFLGSFSGDRLATLNMAREN